MIHVGIIFSSAVPAGLVGPACTHSDSTAALLPADSASLFNLDRFAGELPVHGRPFQSSLHTVIAKKTGARSETNGDE